MRLPTLRRYTRVVPCVLLSRPYNPQLLALTLTPGTRLGPYEVVAQIGVGGMGEVYKATDTNLKRAVAIKVLPASVAADPERLARFQREAEVLAALNHPNIAAIYGLERSDGITALVMELVEGETLKGPLPLDEALRIAAQSTAVALSWFSHRIVPKTASHFSARCSGSAAAQFSCRFC